MENTIKYLYEKFLLRDLLSFVMPGALIVLTGYGLLFNFEPVELFRQSRMIHGLLYIPLFGLFYLVGFSLQSAGRLIGLIRIHWRDNIPFNQRIAIFYNSLLSRDIYQEVREDSMNFSQASEGHEWVQQLHERSVVLKQMAANSWFAVIVLGSMFISDFFKIIDIRVILGFWAVFLSLALLWAYRDAEKAAGTIKQRFMLRH